MGSWRENYDKLSSHISAGFICFVEPMGQKQIQWLLKANNVIDISDYNSGISRCFLMKPSIATLFRCKFGQVTVRKMAAYQLANLLTTEYIVKNRYPIIWRKFWLEINCTVLKIKNGDYGALSLKQIGYDRLKWECGSSWGWITHHYEEGKKGFIDYSHSSVFVADQSEFTNFCNKEYYETIGSNQSICEFADEIESFSLNRCKSKPLSLCKYIDPDINSYDFGGLSALFDLMNEHVSYFRPSIPEPDFIAIPEINTL